MNILPTFLDFLAEDSTSAEIGGWFNVAKNLEYDDPDEPHHYILGRNWEEVGITYAEIKKNIQEENAARQRGGGHWAKQPPLDPDNPEDQANNAIMDGEYGRFYNEGWVRFYRHDRFGMMEFTSSMKTLQRSKKKIMELVKKYHPGQILLSDEYSKGGATFHKIVSGEELRYEKWKVGGI